MMRGLSSWMRSQVRPMRSRAPGAKFSTITSQILTSSSRICLPFRIFRVERDRALVVVEHGEIEAVRVGNVAQLAARDVADAGRSTLITSAPNQASNCVQVGPDCTCVKSRILTPSRALLIVSSCQAVRNLSLAAAALVFSRERSKWPLLRKAAQKFLLCWAWGCVGDNAHGPALIKFFCFFLFTKSSLPLPLRSLGSGIAALPGFGALELVQEVAIFLDMLGQIRACARGSAGRRGRHRDFRARSGCSCGRRSNAGRDHPGAWSPSGSRAYG